MKQCNNTKGGSSKPNPPPREVPHDTSSEPTETQTDTATSTVNILSTENTTPNPESILTQVNNPHKVERVRRIIQEVTIGPDVMPEQWQAVQDILKEYADCFALSIKEVNPIPGAVHKLNIPEGTTFHTTIPLRSYNPEQRAFINAKVNKMLEVGIIHPIHPGKVHFVAQTVLVQKAHDGQGLCIEELKHIVNKQCLKQGLPSEFNIPPPPEQGPSHLAKPDMPIKWHMCRDFGGINKVTEVTPVPQGDIHAKQLQLSGHRYLHVFDFAAGFYGIVAHPDSQPYITFYVEG